MRTKMRFIIENCAQQQKSEYFSAKKAYTRAKKTEWKTVTAKIHKKKTKATAHVTTTKSTG